jgi:hypothetical protein
MLFFSKIQGSSGYPGLTVGDIAGVTTHPNRDLPVLSGSAPMDELTESKNARDAEDTIPYPVRPRLPSRETVWARAAQLVTAAIERAPSQTMTRSRIRQKLVTSTPTGSRSIRFSNRLVGLLSTRPQARSAIYCRRVPIPGEH